MNSFGNLIRVLNANDNTLIWELGDVDALGNITKQNFGNGLETIKTFDTDNFPSTIRTDGIQDMAYIFNPQTGNLEEREDRLKSLSETFSYDILNQLEDIEVNGQMTHIAYNQSIPGRIVSKEEVGAYAYGGVSTNRLSAVIPPDPSDPNSSEIPLFTQDITYTSFNSIKTVTEDQYHAIFSYGPDDQRKKMTVTENGGHLYHRIYAGGIYEVQDHRDKGVQYFHYIFGGDGLAAIYVLEEGGQGTLYFVHKDYLGSITQLTDSEGNLVEEYSYDAWGRRRNPNDGSYNNLNSERITDRGYTGHEHMFDGFGIINMNGRIYDPILGLMMSPDNYVQDHTHALNFNRYAYCYNNPLRFTDPSGEIIFTALAAIFNPALLPMAIQADIGWITGGISSSQAGGSFWDGAIPGAVMGAINGGLSMISPIKIPFGNSGFGASIAPQLAVGTSGMGFGINATIGYTFKGFTAGVNLGGTYYTSAIGTGESGFEGRIGYGIGYEGKKFQGGIGSTYFYSGETSQQTGQIYAGGGKWKITYENDTWAPVPGLIIPGGAEVDKYRTAALRFDITGGRLEGAKAGFSIFTGESDGRRNPDGSFRETSEGYRLGAIYLGYKNYRVGYNSERNIRGPIQNGFHDLMDYPHFQVLDINDKFYGGYYSTNPYTLW